jgi:hypothetical protein
VTTIQWQSLTRKHSLQQNCYVDFKTCTPQQGRYVSPACDASPILLHSHAYPARACTSNFLSCSASSPHHFTYLLQRFRALFAHRIPVGSSNYTMPGQCLEAYACIRAAVPCKASHASCITPCRLSVQHVSCHYTLLHFIISCQLPLHIVACRYTTSAAITPGRLSIHNVSYHYTLSHVITQYQLPLHLAASQKPSHLPHLLLRHTHVNQAPINHPPYACSPPACVLLQINAHPSWHQTSTT